MSDQNLSSVDRAAAVAGKAVFADVAGKPGQGAVDGAAAEADVSVDTLADTDVGVAELPLDAFEVMFKAQAGRTARDARAALRIGPADRARLHALDQAQHFHGDGDVELTVPENLTHWLTKSFVATADGLTIEKGAAPVTGYGRLVRATLPKDRPMAGLTRLLAGLKGTQALMAARLPGTASMRRMIVKDKWLKLSDAERGELDGDGPLFRGKRICYATGQPALLIIDHDSKDLSDETRLRIQAAGGLRAVLTQIDPQWSTAGVLLRPSVSTGVRDTRTGVTTPDGGLHVYTIVADGGDIKRYVKVLADRLTLAGYAYVRVSAAGSLLKRGPIDLSNSGVPYWLSFEANAVLEPGPHGDHLEHVPGARKCRSNEGPRLDTSALPDLTTDEARQVAETWTRLKAEKEPEARTLKLARGVKETARLVKAGVAQDDAERIVLARSETGRLSLDDEYWFDEALPSGKRSATGWELLEAADVWFASGRKRTGADPLEPSYGGGAGGVASNKAVWMLNQRGVGLFVFSQAHGGQEYVLAYAAEHAVELMQEMKAQGDSAIVRLAKLNAFYRQTYVPVDDALATAILHQAGLPLPIMLEFGDPTLTDDHTGVGDLARERLIGALKAEDWDQLVRLRRLGRFRDEALAELRAEDEEDPFDDPFGFRSAWDKVMAALASRDKAACETGTVQLAARTAGVARALPVIEVYAGKQHVAADAAEQALAAGLDTHPVLQRGGDLVRPCLIPARDAGDKEINAAGFRSMTRPMMIDDLGHRAAFRR